MLRCLLFLAALSVLATAHECPEHDRFTSPGGVEYCDLRESMTLKDCHEECVAMDHFSLPCVSSAAENAFLQTRVTSTHHLWTGLYQTPGSSGAKVGWQDTNWLSPGCTSSFRNWERHEPNDFFCTEENVAAIRKDSGAAATWIDISAKEDASCVCQKTSQTDPSGEHNDSVDEHNEDLHDEYEDVIDQLEDGEVAPECGGVEDAEDWFLDTDKEEEDIEPAAHTAPSGVSYLDTGKRGNFAKCFSTCDALGFSLPTPKTLEDSNFLSGIRGGATGGKRPATWLGLYQSKRNSASAGWRDENWASLETNSFRNWAHSEPNDFKCVDETCVIANLPEEQTGMWYDAPCAWEEPACICQQTTIPADAEESGKKQRFMEKTLPRLMEDHERNTCWAWGENRWEAGFWSLVGALSLSVLLNIIILICCCVCFCCQRKQHCGAPRMHICHPNVSYGVTPNAMVHAGIPHQQPVGARHLQRPDDTSVVEGAHQQQVLQARAINDSHGDLVFPIAQVAPGASAPPYSASAPPNSAPFEDYQHLEAVKPEPWAVSRPDVRGAGGGGGGCYPQVDMSTRGDDKV